MFIFILGVVIGVAVGAHNPAFFRSLLTSVRAKIKAVFNKE